MTEVKTFTGIIVCILKQGYMKEESTRYAALSETRLYACARWSIYYGSTVIRLSPNSIYDRSEQSFIY